MTRGAWLAVGLLLAWVALTVLVDGPELAPLGGLFGAGIVGFGLVVMFGGRCPRCRTRLVPQPGLRLPERCPRCRVRFGTPG